MNKSEEKELRQEYYENQCEEKEGDEERCQVYENDGKLVADWWIAKITSLLSRREEELVKEIEKMKENLVTFNDNVPMNCNPRCHDSGREESFDKVLAIIHNKKQL